MPNGKKYKVVIWSKIPRVGTFGDTFEVDLTRKSLSSGFNRVYTTTAPTSLKTLSGKEINLNP